MSANSISLSEDTRRVLDALIANETQFEETTWYRAVREFAKLAQQSSGLQRVFWTLAEDFVETVARKVEREEFVEVEHAAALQRAATEFHRLFPAKGAELLVAPPALTALADQIVARKS
nr:hypothetical protein [Nitrosomonas nitrosa]